MVTREHVAQQQHSTEQRTTARLHAWTAQLGANEDRSTLASLGLRRGIEHHITVRSRLKEGDWVRSLQGANCRFRPMRERLPARTPVDARQPVSPSARRPSWLAAPGLQASRPPYSRSRARVAVSLPPTHEVRLGRIGRRHVSSPDIALCVVRRSYTCRIFHPFF